MEKKKVIAIDVKEIAKPKIESLGLILLEMIPKLNDYDLLLLSDVAIPEKFVPLNAKVVVRNIPYSGGCDLIKYQYWMKKQCEQNKAEWYFQINHFSLFKIKGAKQIVVVHDLYPLEQLEKTSSKLKITYWISLFLTMLNADTIFTVYQSFQKEDQNIFFGRAEKYK